MADLKLLNELLVFGYIRIESQVNDIPDAIKIICMDYLQYMTDEWIREDSVLSADTPATTIKLKPLSANDHTPSLTTALQSTLITRRKPGEWQQVYGTLQIDAQFTQTVVWTLSIISTKYSSMTYAYIGIASQGGKKYGTKWGTSGKGLDYGYCAFNGSTESIYQRPVKQAISKKTGPVLKKGDRVEVCLNQKEHQLSFAVNGKRLFVGFSRIKPRTYCLGVVVKHEDTEISLDEVAITRDSPSLKSF